MNGDETEHHAAAALAIYAQDSQLGAACACLVERIRARRSDRATDATASMTAPFPATNER
jgi:hypothetical protein